MENTIPKAVLEWLKERGLTPATLPEIVVESVRENAIFLKDLVGFDAAKLGALLFPNHKNTSHQTLTTKLLYHGSLEEACRVPAVLGFNSSVIFTANLRQVISDSVKAMTNLRWDQSVFTLLPACKECKTISLTVSAKFCHSCGEKLAQS